MLEELKKRIKKAYDYYRERNDLWDVRIHILYGLRHLMDANVISDNEFDELSDYSYKIWQRKMQIDLT